MSKPQINSTTSQNSLYFNFKKLFIFYIEKTLKSRSWPIKLLPNESKPKGTKSVMGVKRDLPIKSSALYSCKYMNIVIFIFKIVPVASRNNAFQLILLFSPSLKNKWKKPSLGLSTKRTSEICSKFVTKTTTLKCYVKKRAW